MNPKVDHIKKTSHQQGGRMLLASGSFILLLLMIGGMTWRMLANQKDITDAQERRHQSYLLAAEMRQSSDDLTRLARTYVVTGEPKYEEQYWTVLAIRNGKSPRPQEYNRIYWDFMAADGIRPRPDNQTISLQQLMKDTGFTEAEFAKLKEAQANSDGLVKIETIAMNAMKGLFDDGRGYYTKKGEPNPEMARELMHSKAYHLEKARIMNPIDEFFAMLEKRTSSEVRLRVDQSYFLFRALLVLVGLGTLAVAIYSWRIRRANQEALVQIDLEWKSILAKIDCDWKVILTNVSEVIVELDRSAVQTASAARQVSLSSNTLSSGASLQASSVEETSASLEEMTSMIRATADNAQKAKALALESRSVVAAGCQTMGEMDRTMVEMNQAMAAIESSSGEVAKIVKGIDEIAFQTNILALNAAVEAARAGEAGAGFAVVADEVRSLAQRSAAAAKETAAKIEAAIASSRNGSASCRNGSASSLKVGESLKNIADKISATDALVADIATAAREQTQGIEQINRAIGEMEQVTQSNASSAEESASAAEELAAQAETLNELVSKLRELIGGAAADPAPTTPTPVSKARSTVVVDTHKPAARKPAPHLPPKSRVSIPMPQDPPVGAAGEDQNFRNF